MFEIISSLANKYATNSSGCVIKATFKVDSKRKEFREDAAFEFGSEEDAPMCLDVHPTVSICGSSVVLVIGFPLTARMRYYYREIPVL